MILRSDTDAQIGSSKRQATCYQCIQELPGCGETCLDLSPLIQYSRREDGRLWEDRISTGDHRHILHVNHPTFICFE
jgi:hypothetical protein